MNLNRVTRHRGKWTAFFTGILVLAVIALVVFMWPVSIGLTAGGIIAGTIASVTKLAIAASIAGTSLVVAPVATGLFASKIAPKISNWFRRHKEGESWFGKFWKRTKREDIENASRREQSSSFNSGKSLPDHDELDDASNAPQIVENNVGLERAEVNESTVLNESDTGLMQIVNGKNGDGLYSLTTCDYYISALLTIIRRDKFEALNSRQREIYNTITSSLAHVNSWMIKQESLDHDQVLDPVKYDLKEAKTLKEFIDELQKKHESITRLVTQKELQNQLSEPKKEAKSKTLPPLHSGASVPDSSMNRKRPLPTPPPLIAKPLPSRSTQKQSVVVVGETHSSQSSQYSQSSPLKHVDISPKLLKEVNRLLNSDDGSVLLKVRNVFLQSLNELESKPDSNLNKTKSNFNQASKVLKNTINWLTENNLLNFNLNLRIPINPAAVKEHQYTLAEFIEQLRAQCLFIECMNKSPELRAFFATLEERATEITFADLDAMIKPESAFTQQQSRAINSILKNLYLIRQYVASIHEIHEQDDLLDLDSLQIQLNYEAAIQLLNESKQCLIDAELNVIDNPIFIPVFDAYGMPYSLQAYMEYVFAELTQWDDNLENLFDLEMSAQAKQNSNLNQPLIPEKSVAQSFIHEGDTLVSKQALTDMIINFEADQVTDDEYTAVFKTNTLKNWSMYPRTLASHDSKGIVQTIRIKSNDNKSNTCFDILGGLAESMSQQDNTASQISNTP